MTTKTIPGYLEDERQKGRKAQQSMEEAARIQPLNHGHHRTPKPPKLKLRSSVKAVPKSEKKDRISEKAPLRAKDSDEHPSAGVTPRLLFHGVTGRALRVPPSAAQFRISRFVEPGTDRVDSCMIFTVGTWSKESRSGWQRAGSIRDGG